MPEPEHPIRSLADHYFARMLVNEFTNFLTSHSRQALDAWRRSSFRIVYGKTPDVESSPGHVILPLSEEDFELLPEHFELSCRRLPVIRTIFHRLLDNLKRYSIDGTMSSYATPLVRLTVTSEIANFSGPRRRRILEILTVFHFVHTRLSTTYDTEIPNVSDVPSIASSWNSAKRTVFKTDQLGVPEFTQYLRDMKLDPYFKEL